MADVELRTTVRYMCATSLGPVLERRDFSGRDLESGCQPRIE